MNKETIVLSNVESFEHIKAFLRFGDDDVRRLTQLAPFVAAHGPAVTERFYEYLLAEPQTAALLEGKVEQLVITHNKWMLGLVGGQYGSAYFESRRRIGMVHVKIGVDPAWVEATMSLIRLGLIEKLAGQVADPGEFAAKAGSLIKICDLDLLVINLAYYDARLTRLSDFTGMKPALIENVIRLGNAA